MEFTDRERATLLAGLYEVRITWDGNPEIVARVLALVDKLGGEPNDAHFGGAP